MMLAQEGYEDATLSQHSNNWRNVTFLSITFISFWAPALYGLFRLELLFSCNFLVFIAFHSSISTPKKYFWSWLVPDESAKYYYDSLKSMKKDSFLIVSFLKSNTCFVIIWTFLYIFGSHILASCLWLDYSFYSYQKRVNLCAKCVLSQRFQIFYICMFEPKRQHEYLKCKCQWVSKRQTLKNVTRMLELCLEVQNEFLLRKTLE